MAAARALLLDRARILVEREPVGVDRVGGEEQDGVFGQRRPRGRLQPDGWSG